jgi:hypothetical protein
MLLLGLISGVIVYRPDISLAMSVIDHSLEYAEDDLRVNLASQYLIFQADSSEYSKLGLYILNCYSMESPYDFPPYDYRAASATRILGHSSSKESEDLLIDMLTRDYPQEGPPRCLRYAFLGLKLKEDGYLQIWSIVNNTSRYATVREIGISVLGQSGNLDFVDPLIAITQYDDIFSLRAAAVRALAVLGTSSAIETIEHLAINDPHEYVREEALRVLESISQ